MAKYSTRDLSVNAVLTTMNVMHTQGSFAANKMFAVVPIEEQTFRFKVFDRADALRTDARKRTPGSLAAQKTIGITETSGFAEEIAIASILPDEDRATKDSIVDDALQSEMLSQDCLIRRDLDFALVFLANAVWGNTDQVGVAAAPGANGFVFWDAANASIFTNVKAWKRTVKLACGRWPNVACITPDVWDVITDDPDIVDRIKHTMGPIAVVTKELVAALFELEEIVVIDSVRTTSAEGAATFTSSFMDTEKMLLAYREKSPSKRKPAAGYTFTWAKYDQIKEPMEDGGAAILKWREEKIHSDMFEAQMLYLMAIVTGSAGILARNILST